MSEGVKQMRHTDARIELNSIAEALAQLRDTLVELSLALKDQLADSPSAWREEVTTQADLQLADILKNVRRSDN
ncbi:hypothetical protein [Rhodoferax sp. GW822-FHT02A01]|uniref:hypothetical protein n=1 Tax=Rhodoferax sp. GW822-FHT02A01 TaxID=3141537 RepID=UPI00315D7CFE